MTFVHPFITKGDFLTKVELNLFFFFSFIKKENRKKKERKKKRMRTWTGKFQIDKNTISGVI